MRRGRHFGLEVHVLTQRVTDWFDKAANFKFSETSFGADIQAGHLANYTFVIPPFLNSKHSSDVFACHHACAPQQRPLDRVGHRVAETTPQLGTGQGRPDAKRH